MHCHLLRPSLWRSTGHCDRGLEAHFDVDEQPYSVRLHHPQHHQNVLDLQGERGLPHEFLSYTFLQPTEFNQIEHERRFKFVLKGIFILITVYVVLILLLAQVTEPGALIGKVHFLARLFDPEDTMVRSTRIVILFCNGVTVFVMITSELCACIMRPASTITLPVCSAGFIVNTIPFFSLNISIVLALVVHVVTGVFFKFLGRPFWLYFSAILMAILVTNQGARKHVATRVRQQIDTLTIGGNNTVHPIVEIALVPLPDAQTPAPPTRA